MNVSDAECCKLQYATMPSGKGTIIIKSLEGGLTIENIFHASGASSNVLSVNRPGDSGH